MKLLYRACNESRSENGIDVLPNDEGLIWNHLLMLQFIWPHHCRLISSELRTIFSPASSRIFFPRMKQRHDFFWPERNEFIHPGPLSEPEYSLPSNTYYLDKLQWRGPGSTSVSARSRRLSCLHAGKYNACTCGLAWHPPKLCIPWNTKNIVNLTQESPTQ
jgi:hypothetical protein